MRQFKFEVLGGTGIRYGWEVNFPSEGLAQYLELRNGRWATFNPNGTIVVHRPAQAYCAVLDIMGALVMPEPNSVVTILRISSVIGWLDIGIHSYTNDEIKSFRQPAIIIVRAHYI